MTPPVCTLVVVIASTSICTELPYFLASTTKRGGILSESIDEEEKEPICKPGGDYPLLENDPAYTLC